MSLGEAGLRQLLATLDPVAREEAYVYAVLDPAHPALALAAAVVREAEGVTAVLPKAQADANALPYDFVAAWITLTVHSSLDAVGLTAAFSAALGDAGISCNVLAGYHHDHLLVPEEQRDEAMQVLVALRDAARTTDRSSDGVQQPSGWPGAG